MRCRRLTSLSGNFCTPPKRTSAGTGLDRTHREFISHKVWLPGSEQVDIFSYDVKGADLTPRQHLNSFLPFEGPSVAVRDP